MKIYFNILAVVSLFIFISCTCHKEIQKTETEKIYIFFLHNKFLEDSPDGAFAKEYGVNVQYSAIVESFRKDGFIVISEKRKPKTNGTDYARKVVSQIDSLISKGVQPNHITIIGTSKGGYTIFVLKLLCFRTLISPMNNIML